MTESSDKKEMDVGVQPLDVILTEIGLNSDVVGISLDQLTHKQVKKRVVAVFLKTLNEDFERNKFRFGRWRRSLQIERFFNYKDYRNIAKGYI